MPAAPSHSVKAHAIARLEKNPEDMQRLMKAMVSPMQHMSTHNNPSQESLLYKTRKEQYANAVCLAALDDVSRGGRGCGGGGKEAGDYAAGQSR
eukprot:6183381-Pleurochrysis_carterae.AAC.3